MPRSTISPVPGQLASSVDRSATIDLSDDLRDVAVGLAHRYRQVRRQIDTDGTLFARHELQSALILVRRLRRYVDAAEAELEAELEGLGDDGDEVRPARRPGRPLRVAR